MSDVYIVGYDGTDASKRALDYARARARRSGANLHLLMVLEWSPYSFLTPQELEERHKRRSEEIARAEALIDPQVKALADEGLKASREVRYGHAAELFCEVAEAKKAAQIVIGRTGSTSLAQRILGGLAMSLVQAAPVPVTVVP
ncbi:MAG: universal stress protein [Rhodobiaceae bacterium]|nr:universal stress protein [Rhodobiaceae bacterium]MCC0017014.1 universal stress protein [Rhodobiaceae bacterium]MCC0053733.1 universal stress protein [Rhodobiaceae bacterium]